AGLTTLRRLRADGVYAQLETQGARLEAAFLGAAKAAKVPLTVQRVGSMLTPFFQDGPVRNFEEASRSDTARPGRFHQAALAAGVYWPPSQYEAAFVSLAHDERAFQRAEEGLLKAFRAL